MMNSDVTKDIEVSFVIFENSLLIYFVNGPARTSVRAWNQNHGNADLVCACRCCVSLWYCYGESRGTVFCRIRILQPPTSWARWTSQPWLDQQACEAADPGAQQPCWGLRHCCQPGVTMAPRNPPTAIICPRDYLPLLHSRHQSFA